ncbi:MAG: DUF3341 domain-containing protein [Bacteroidota bacterium]
MVAENKKHISGYFEDETDLKIAIKSLQEKSVNIKDVFTPFPVHGLEKTLKYRRSHLPKVAFWGGVLGLILAMAFQIWIFTVDYPITFGGKPYLSIPTFIPVAFELTVLFAAFSMVFAFLMRSQLGIGAKNKIYDERVTDDRFLILLEAKEDEVKTYESALGETGALNITLHD